MAQPKEPNSSHQHRKLTIKLVLATVAMFGFGFALVPLYDVMCEALGINGKPSDVAAVQPVGMHADITRTVRVEFLSHVNPDMPWSFEPATVVMDVHPGEVIQTEYRARNNSEQRIIGQAVPSVSPGEGAVYFNKIECFCFNHQPLDGMASTSMPLIFYIEPDIPDSIHTLTLSYTLYNFSALQRQEPSLAAKRSE
ncbi:cytochrome c oxidase assembly protein [Vibrio sp. SM6]|uniref:Cytochrome c oxidase assembly protein CtaG n=1 Tax=Vibrio agarilyticus TaxID=2726741 RepID=A0A7X8TT36_9VIBR|nr:cytochrome c oxidase assembly protein [Vibrio agarilyticus]NLS13798.1 cytochrome c oxidase assembly protein [Vibrio agarilyticus]